MRYVVAEVESREEGIRYFTVTPTRAIAGAGEKVSVWFSRGHPRCSECSGPLVAMSASCRHARAVRRHLTQQAQP